MNIRFLGRPQRCPESIQVKGLTLSVPGWLGSTPLVELIGLDAGPCRVLAKLEQLGPTGSIKDRIAWAMVEHAKATGRLRPGMTVVEASSGNTSVAIGAACRADGFGVRALVPTDLPEFRWKQNEAYGVELDTCGATEGHVIDGATRRAMVGALVEADPDRYCTLDQFSSPANAVVHEQTTGVEIATQAREGGVPIDCFVNGVGTGGTISGIGRALRADGQAKEIIMADPVGSPLADLVAGSESTASGRWTVSDGIGATAVPGNLDRGLITGIDPVERADALRAVAEVSRATGLLAGPAAGYAVEAALRWCRRQTEAKTVLVVVCDRGEHYLSDAAFVNAVAEPKFEHA